MRQVIRKWFWAWEFDKEEQWLNDMAAKGKAIIISTHILEEVDAVCTKVVVIADGEKKFDGTPDELRAMDPSGKLDVVFRNLTMKEAK